ncbi:metallophosphoesterase [Persephonella sp. KM09-Lau-8]|uniref:metallophosphoesterase n=1 Tax=Persephonella sp. KM09-Lau-8 TaxID=1158345 RepID=UPI00049732F4|nr:metallophosphoesterase [Persephonella sp. KM09-Lau-8]
MDRPVGIETDKEVVIIGDIHGCLIEFQEMVSKIQSRYGEDTIIVSLGDTIDRGDYNVETLEYCFELQKTGRFIEIQSNHNLKLYRWFKGRKVNISSGMKKTIDQIIQMPEKKQEELKEKYIRYYESLPLYLIINGSVVVAHAGIKDEMIGKVNRKIKDFVIFGETTGRYTEKGFPERLDWTKNRKVDKYSPIIVYGHVVFEKPYINNKAYGIDTGCVLGNMLTAYNPFRDEFLFVQAKKQYFSFD